MTETEKKVIALIEKIESLEQQKKKISSTIKSYSSESFKLAAKREMQVLDQTIGTTVTIIDLLTRK